MRNTEPIHSEPAGGHYGKDAVRETHPAFGVATVTRSTGGGRALFQSDLLHNETIVLRVHRADRTRDLNHDWTFATRELIEIEMSLAQWGSLISSQGIGGGVPVTIRSTETVRDVPEFPLHSRIAENLREVRGAFNKTYEHVRSSWERVKDVLENKRGIKAQREAVASMDRTLGTLSNNAEFAVTSMKDAAENITSQAKADIEAHILRSAALTGVEAPVSLPPLEIETPSAADDPRFELGEVPDDGR